jgi:hypothetical protein
VEECDAGADDELGSGEVHGEVAEVFYAEGGGEFAVVEGEADFFPGFAAGDLICGDVRTGTAVRVGRERGRRRYRVFRPECRLCLLGGRRGLAGISM